MEVGRGHLPNGVLKIDVVHGGSDAGAAGMSLRWHQKQVDVSSLSVSHGPLIKCQLLQSPQ